MSNELIRIKNKLISLLEILYLKNGLTEEVLRLSQLVDIIIVKEQSYKLGICS
ncbi:MAG: hypothetical protein ACRC7N_02120 [Clostridium sp.]